MIDTFVSSRYRKTRPSVILRISPGCKMITLLQPFGASLSLGAR